MLVRSQIDGLTFFDTKMILEFLIDRILGDKINKKDAILH